MAGYEERRGSSSRYELHLLVATECARLCNAKVVLALTQLLYRPQRVGSLPHPAAHSHGKAVVVPHGQLLVEVCSGSGLAVTSFTMCLQQMLHKQHPPHPCCSSCPTLQGSLWYQRPKCVQATAQCSGTGRRSNHSECLHLGWKY